MIMEIVDRFLKINFQYSYSRRFGYQKIRLFNYGYSKGYQETFGYTQIGYSIYRIIDGNVFEYFSTEEADKLKDFFVKKFSEKKFILTTGKNLAERIKKDSKDYVKFFDSLPKDYSKLPDSKIVEILEKYYKKDRMLSIWAWFIFTDVEGALNLAVEKALKEYGLAEEKIAETMMTLANPLKMVIPDMERLSLLKISVLPEKKIKQAIEKHAQKFAQLSVYEIDHQSREMSYFENEILEIKKRLNKIKIEKGIKEIFKKYKDRQKNNQKLLNQFRNIKDLYYLFKLYSDYSYLKDLKPYTRDYGSYSVKSLFGEIVKRLNITLHQAIFLTEEEIPKFLENKNLVSKEDLDKRSENSVYLCEGKNICLITDPEILKKIDSHINKKEDVQELRGLGVSAGLAKGRASIVLSNNDFKKFNAGEILVASATRPEFIPVMKKSAAIITDEGGFLSHAAIVSRELGKPCVVGTKKATRILKDGDLVEVDADNGIVRIIK